MVGFWRAAVFAALFPCLAAAQDVTLTSRDGALAIAGTLQGYDGEFFRIDSAYGALTVDASGVICDGPACPDLTAPKAVIRLVGEADAGGALLPPLIAAFAKARGLVYAPPSAADAPAVLTDPATNKVLAEISFRAFAPEAARAEVKAGRAELMVASVTEPDMGAKPMALDALVPIVAMTVGMSLPALIVLVVLKAIFQPGGGSARKSLLPDAADHAGMSLDRANSINEALSSAGFAIGPALAASLIAAFDSYAAFWLAAAASLASAVFAFMIRVHEKQEPLEGDPESSHPIKYAMQGFVTLVKLPALLIVFAAFMILSVIYMPTEMVVLPRYYSGIGQPEQMGYLITAMSVFTVLGALLFEKAHQLVGYANLVRIASVVIGLCMVPMSMLPERGVSSPATARRSIEAICLPRRHSAKNPLRAKTDQPKPSSFWPDEMRITRSSPGPMASCPARN